jgi:DNA-binding response OmpR family regulator
MRILLVEDEKKVASFIKRGLEEEGYAVDVASEGEQGLEMALARVHDLIVLDIRLPKMDGPRVLKDLRREQVMTPVLLLTVRATIEEKVLGLDAGADDYLTKPFAMDELVARVHALLRRPSAILSQIFTAGDISFDAVSREARVGDAPLPLSPREAGALEQLLRRSGKVVPKAIMEEGLYGIEDDISSNSVEVLIHRLRKKLTAAGAGAAVHTVRGVGYMILPDEG